MPEPFWYSYRLVSASGQELRAFEHELSITLPWRRYNPSVRPRLLPESPSIIYLGPEEREGAELSIRRVSYQAQPNNELVVEMLGELAEVWVQMTMHHQI